MGCPGMPVDWSERAVLVAGLGAALGGILSYFAGVYLSRGDWPWGTIVVNPVGSFFAAIIMFGAISRGWFSRACLDLGIWNRSRAAAST